MHTFMHNFICVITKDCAYFYMYCYVHIAKLGMYEYSHIIINVGLFVTIVGPRPTYMHAYAHNFLCDYTIK